MKKNEQTKIFLEGLRDGLPIGAGYFAVAFWGSPRSGPG